jgi:hypothetical protein
MSSEQFYLEYVEFYLAHQNVCYPLAVWPMNGGCVPSCAINEVPMELLLIIVVLVLLFGGGGYWGRRRGHW